MARAVTHRTWYRIALGREGRPPMLVAAQGEHLGVAVAAAEKHVEHSFALAASVAQGDDIPLGESVGKHAVVTVGELGDDVAIPAFAWPAGVLPEIGQAEGVMAVRRGFVVHPDPAMFVVEAMPERDELVETFLAIAEKLPAGDNLEVRVLDHFPGEGDVNVGLTDVWLTSRVTMAKIVRFLDGYDTELLENGHVELSIYLRAARATLRLTEHKTIVFLVDRAAGAGGTASSLEADVVRWLGERELPRLAPAELVTVARVPHFHYRPAKSRDRKKLGEELYRQRLRRVDTLRGGVSERSAPSTPSTPSTPAAT